MQGVGGREVWTPSPPLLSCHWVQYLLAGDYHCPESYVNFVWKRFKLVMKGSQ